MTYFENYYRYIIVTVVQIISSDRAQDFWSNSQCDFKLFQDLHNGLMGQVFKWTYSLSKIFKQDSSPALS